MFKTTRTQSSARLVAMLIASLLFLEPALPLYADAPPLPDAPPPQSLQIVILDGEGALNNISERTAREPIVQVQDENHKPLAGAAVLFAIHGGTSGAGASFSGGASSLSVVTDANGLARAVGMVANPVKGPWQIQVTASYGKLTTSTQINENNVAPPAAATNPPPSKPPFHWPLSKPTTIVGSIIVLGAVVAIVVVANNNNNSTNITTGGGTVGPPGGAFRPGIHIHF
jgi:hypothetical protein